MNDDILKKMQIPLFQQEEIQHNESTVSQIDKEEIIKESISSFIKSYEGDIEIINKEIDAFEEIHDILEEVKSNKSHILYSEMNDKQKFDIDNKYSINIIEMEKRFAILEYINLKTNSLKELLK